MTRLEMKLAYDLAPGWLAPYVESLMQGRALARACGSCGHVSYPPIRSCTCQNPAPHWLTLSGEAEILFRTDGADGSFALVRFAGADTNAVVKLVHLPEGSRTGSLIAAGRRIPSLTLGPIEQGLANDTV